VAPSETPEISSPNNVTYDPIEATDDWIYNPDPDNAQFDERVADIEYFEDDADHNWEYSPDVYNAGDNYEDVQYGYDDIDSYELGYLQPPWWNPGVNSMAYLGDSPSGYFTQMVQKNLQDEMFMYDQEQFRLAQAKREAPLHTLDYVLQHIECLHATNHALHTANRIKDTEIETYKQKIQTLEHELNSAYLSKVIAETQKEIAEMRLEKMKVQQKHADLQKKQRERQTVKSIRPLRTAAW